MQKRKNYMWSAIAIGGGAVLLLLVFAVFFTDSFGAFLTNSLYYLGSKLGWAVLLLSMIALVLAVVIVISKFGDIKIGGEDAKPLFSMWNWCAMSICGGIGTGILFWAMAEPMYFFMQPPVAANVEAGTRGAAIFAISQSMWHWGFVQYSLYALVGISFALVTYNRKKSLSFGSVINSVCGKDVPWLTTFMHSATIVVATCATAVSMAAGILQIGGGLFAGFSIPENAVTYFVIAAIFALIFILSCLSGIGKGLKYISNITMYLFIGLLFYVLIFSDRHFISTVFVEGFAHMMDNLFTNSALMNTMAPGDTWAADWTVQYFADMINCSLLIGMFLSRMAKGRTVRQFMLVQVLIPAFFSMIWIAIFGGAALSLQTSGTMDIWASLNEYGMQSTIYQILKSLPGSNLIIIAFVICCCFSFCTLADPISAALATLGTKNLSVNDEAPRTLKIAAGLAITVLSYCLIVSNGVSAIKGIRMIACLFSTAIVVFCWIATFKNLIICGKEPNYGTLPDLEKIGEDCEKS